MLSPNSSVKSEPQRTGNHFTRSRWNHAGEEFDRFFQAFVPSQYNIGFCWRCEIVGQGEKQRAAPFEQILRNQQELIARNAEVLLELFEETDPGDLDIMRAAGKRLLFLSGTEISAEDHIDGDIPSLRESMARRHHEKWLEQFWQDIQSGKRNDPNHRGAKPFDELPVIERQIMKVQTLANWRVLGAMSDRDYILIRNLAEKSDGESLQG